MPDSRVTAFVAAGCTAFLVASTAGAQNQHAHGQSSTLAAPAPAGDRKIPLRSPAKLTPPRGAPIAPPAVPSYTAAPQETYSPWRQETRAAEGDALPAASIFDDPGPSTPNPEQHVVAIRRGNRILGTGVVLHANQQILTSLSALEHGNDLSVDLANGRRGPARVVATHRGYDLALLDVDLPDLPQGLALSASLPESKTLHKLVRTYKGRLASVKITVSETTEARGADGYVIPEAFRVWTNQASVGAPVLDDEGRIVAIVVRACSPVRAVACGQMVPFAVPQHVVRRFLAPYLYARQAVDFGITGNMVDTGVVRGVRVNSVSPASPIFGHLLTALDGAPDIVVAVAGSPVRSQEELEATLRRGWAGAQVRILVFRGGQFLSLAVPLWQTEELVNPWPTGQLSISKVTKEDPDRADPGKKKK